MRGPCDSLVTSGVDEVMLYDFQYQLRRYLEVSIHREASQQVSLPYWREQRERPQENMKGEGPS
jgi:hypothetical protein